MMRRREAPIMYPLALALIACALCACHSCDDEPPPSAPPAALTQAATAPAPPPIEPLPPDGGLPPEPAPVPYPKPGFTKVVINDEVPICAFPSYEARDKAIFLEDVKPQKLAASSSMVIGAFGPWCVNPDCDDRPMIQCWIDPDESDPNTLIIHSRYSGAHKDGSKCTENCYRMTAGCESPVLTPGKYTLKYGAKTFSLRIPAHLRSPCFVK